MFSSIIHILAPEDDCADLLKEKVKIAAEGSLWSITASVAIVSNLPLVHPDVIVGHPLLTQLTVCRARTVPFIGDHLMCPDTKVFHPEILHLREQHALHRGPPNGPDTKVFHTEILHLREQHALHRGPPNVQTPRCSILRSCIWESSMPFIGDHLMVQTPRCSILRSCIWESSMPFTGDHLMGRDTKVFHTEILHLREQHALHRGPPNGSRHQGVPYWDPASERAACPS